MLSVHAAVLLTLLIKHYPLYLLINLLWTGATVSGHRELQRLIKPLKVEFHALNLNSTLHWQPGSDAAGDITYFVQYKVYGQNLWKNKEECWGIREVFCDLTHETSDIREPYYGRVKSVSAGVHSDWNTSSRFTPWRETKIGPPSLKVTPRNKSIQLKLRAPNSPYKRRRGSKIPMTNYYDLLYRVFLISNMLDEKQKILMYEGTDKVVKIEDLKSEVSYCIVVETYLPMLDRSSACSSKICTVPL
ncbi:interleukin-22 receptor subunit alpha-2 isoform X2 [Pelodiscus sinensis]|uniref:interleukin-22 receptor subunit alpha-2 isoform X2 n=1 Tax=Pelodiscus sinensis TaxID=13735 RepID=UPI000D723C87|nr:interleukin-22 receptor subunit alpha-2 isoform X1 [Pelodiscus sinensis]|eukprot:XP_025033884.1 interleukin-22 receptor subunit alpha-2 isoform X1 [Pelodiscus sinensis]